MMSTIEPGYQFASDNTAGICPAAWHAMSEANGGRAAPYGEDRWTARAADMLREIFEVECEVFFTFNGTAANSLALASMCQPYHSVIAHELAHVETDECGAPAFFAGGTKLVAVSGEAGRVDPKEVDAVVQRRGDVHYPKPKLLSITQSTEAGTIYRPDHLDAIHETKRRFQLNLHMDGARFANALVSNDVAPKEITWKVGVDVLCLGGTKNGMAVGDCVIFFDPKLAEEFEYRCKQAGQLASKMRYLAAPWVGMLESGDWLSNARHANAMAQRLASQLLGLPGVEIPNPVESNGVFARFPADVTQNLRAAGWHFYDFTAAGGSRLMCSWATTEDEVDAFVKHVKTLLPSITA